MINSQVLASIEQTNSRLPSNSARERNLKDLRAPETQVAVTGHQLNLFLGPLFVVYKTLSLVLNAQAVEKESGRRTIPVFWLQTEDHDFREVNSCAMPSAEGSRQIYKLDGKIYEEARISAAHWLISDDICALVQAVSESYGHFAPAGQFIALLAESYKPGALWSDAFMRLLDQVFESSGIVFFNPREDGFFHLAVPTIERSILEHRPLEQMLINQAQALNDMGIKEQVKLRKNTSLAFFHPSAKNQARFRLTGDGENWSLPDHSKKFSANELLDILKTSPERFSTSALLRPLLQDQLFSPVCYIAGPAEEAYLRQLEPVYQNWGIKQPRVVPRARFLLVEPKVKQWLMELGIPASALALPDDKLHRLIAEDHFPGRSETGSPIEKVQHRVAEMLSELKPPLANLDPTLGNSLNKTSAKIAELLRALGARYDKALLARDEVKHARIKKAQVLLFPDRLPQERVYSSLYYMLRYGPELLSRLTTHFSPFSANLIEVEL